MEFFRIHKDIPFMKHALVFNVISLITFLLAVFFLATKGLHFSVEFTGGTLMEVSYAEAPALEKLRDALAFYDAEKRFAIETQPAEDNPACECGAILRGQKKPADCRLFGTVCTPETPTGACMVSSEGACAAHWTYGRFRTRQTDADLRRSA